MDKFWKNVFLCALFGVFVGIVRHLVGVDREMSLVFAFVGTVLISVGGDTVRYFTRK